MQISKKRAKAMIVGIWLLALSIMIPWAMYFELVPLFPDRPDIQMCLEQWPNPISGNFYFFFANLLACYLIPMIVISICYTLIWIKVSTRSRWHLQYQLTNCRYRAETSPARRRTRRRIASSSSRK